MVVLVLVHDVRERHRPRTTIMRPCFTPIAGRTFFQEPSAHGCGAEGFVRVYDQAGAGGDSKASLFPLLENRMLITTYWWKVLALLTAASLRLKTLIDNP